MSEILTPEQFDVQLQNIRWHAILGEDEMAASAEDLVRRHEHALRAERDRLAAEVELLDRQIAYLNGQVARQADEIAKERQLRVQAEADRDRLAARVDKAEDHAQQVSAFAAKMIGHACERHADTIQRMSFNEFDSEMPRSCHWCADERVTALEAEVARIKGQQPLEADRDRLAAAALAEAPTPARTHVFDRPTEEGQ